MNCIVNSYDVALRLVISPKVAHHLLQLDFWHYFIPGFSWRYQTSSLHPKIIIIGAERFQLIYRRDHLEIHTGLQGRMLKDTIVVVGYYIEKQRQLQRQYTIHGSCFSLGKYCIGLIGGISGIGKTSTALYAAEHGAQMISDEKFIWDSRSGDVIGGIKKLDIKKGSSSYTLGEISFYRGSPLTLRMLVIPIVITGGRFVEFLYNRQKCHWHLYEELSRDIRLVNGLVDNFRKPINSFDSACIAVQRAEDSWSWSNKIHMVLMIGTEAQIYRSILRRTSRSTN